MVTTDQLITALGGDEEEHSSFKQMEWATPLYTRNQVDKAGIELVNPDPNSSVLFLIEAFKVVGNWLASHQYPLNTFQVTLRNKSRKIDPNCIVAQRIKRLSSIEHKLTRFSTMQLSQMQDIAGCRVVFEKKEMCFQLVQAYQRSDLRHKLKKTVDYISKPRNSGYRGIHLLYDYISERESKKFYNGLKVEMQIRSALQHAWATAVETVGTFTKQALKSSLGEQDWLRFFSLMGTAIAFLEDAAPVPDTPTDLDSLTEELKKFAIKLDVINLLGAYRVALKTIEEPSVKSAHL